MDHLSYGKVAAGFAIHLLAFVVWLQTCLSDNVPANFVFGDSLVDVGNNNYIASLSKANFVPNGIDFGKPTGRYTNGRTIVDIVGKLSLFNYFSLFCLPLGSSDRIFLNLLLAADFHSKFVS